MNKIFYERPNNSGKKNATNTSKVNNSYYQPNYQPERYMADRNPVISIQSTGKELIANIVLVLLSITLVIALLTLVAEVGSFNKYYDKEANSFWWDYDNGRYVDSISSKYRNEYNGIKETAELTQCYAVCEYFEAASLYKAAVHTGKEDKAMKYLETMAKAYSEMGDVSYLAEDIDAKLGIVDILQ